MSFLAPWFIALGAAAVALPVLFHLLRRTPRGRQPFSTLMFLTPSPPRLTRRSRLENWPLLLLRAAVLGLLALAFGRPFLRQLLEQNESTSVGDRTVVLIDAGASLRRGDLWTRAVAAAQAIVDRAGPHDETALALFATEVQTPIPFAVWRETPHGERAALAQAALQGRLPTWSASHVDTALAAAVEMLDAADAEHKSTETRRQRRIVLVTDLKRGARLDGLQSLEWPKNVPVEVVALSQPTSNAGLHPLAQTEETATDEGPAARPRVLVSNAADSKRESFELRWAGAAGAPPPTTTDKPTSVPAATPETTDVPSTSTTVYVPPGQTRVVRVPAPPAGDVQHLELVGDDEPYDNGLWFVPPTREALRVLHLADEGADEPQSLRYFLERAFAAPLGGSRVTVESLDVFQAEARTPTERDLETIPLVVVAGRKPLPQAWNDLLAARLERGGVVVAPLLKADDVAWRGLLPTSLAAAEAIVATEAELPKQYALLGEIDFRHPLFAPLADPRYSDFTKIRFQRHRRLALSADAAQAAQVVARFDSGDPAIVDLPRGRGHLFLLAAGWQPRESGLGTSSKFVPILQTLVELGRGRPTTTMHFETGHVVDLRTLQHESLTRSPSPLTPLPQEQRETGGPWTITLPDGATRAVAADAPRFAFDFGPGVYAVRASGGEYRIAVNLPPDESKTAPLGVEALEAVGVRLWKPESPAAAELLAEEKRSLQSRELESRQQLWRWCLAAALGLVIVETWYAGRTARKEAV